MSYALKLSGFNACFRLCEDRCHAVVNLIRLELVLVTCIAQLFQARPLLASRSWNILTGVLFQAWLAQV
jgi:hypothetical protein